MELFDQPEDGRVTRKAFAEHMMGIFVKRRSLQLTLGDYKVCSPTTPGCCMPLVRVDRITNTDGNVSVLCCLVFVSVLLIVGRTKNAILEYHETSRPTFAPTIEKPLDARRRQRRQKA